MTVITTDFEFLDRLFACRTRDEMIACLSNRLAAFGIEGFGYCYIPKRTSRTIDADLRERHLHHTYPQGWEQAMGEGDPLLSDPSGPMLLSGPRAVDWTAPEYLLDTLSPERRRRYHAALDLGMAFGMDLVLGEDHRGRRLSGAGLWFAGRTDAGAFWADWARYGTEINGVLLLFDTLARGSKAPEMIGLTPREADLLRYLANGYRSAEASWAMRISEKAFEKHVASAKDKLKARTRDQAVAKALVMGLIDP